MSFTTCLSGNCTRCYFLGKNSPTAAIQLKQAMERDRKTEKEQNWNSLKDVTAQ